MRRGFDADIKAALAGWIAIGPISTRRLGLEHWAARGRLRLLVIGIVHQRAVLLTRRFRGSHPRH
jgi:hypothetical protein